MSEGIRGRSAVASGKKVLTVGAYDRDNFGDILFYLVTEKYMSQHNLVSSGITAADMRHLFGHITLPYNVLLEEDKWDVVWVVGGEVGGVDKTSAIRMLMTPEFEKVYLKLESDIKAKFDEIYSHKLRSDVAAYIPSGINKKQGKDTKYILNSVGIASIMQLPPEIRRATNRVLRQADSIYVRDSESKKYCDKHKIKAVLSPDLVHVVRKVLTIPDKPKKLPSKYILVQFPKLSSEEKEIKAGARRLDKLVDETGIGLVFFAAGTANHHDNFDNFVRIQKLMKNAKKTRIFFDRDPLKLVSCIAHSSLWIGGSLHGRIISIAYSVPRVSLQNPKVAAYAAYWDGQLPYDVTRKNFVSEAVRALAADKAHLDEVAERLEKEADISMKHLLKEAGL